MYPDAETFALICYLVLMDHHGLHYTEAHPQYIREKRWIIEQGYGAIAALDPENVWHVKNHLVKWGYLIPPEVSKILDQDL